MADEGLKIVNTVDNSQLERELKKSRKSLMSVAEAAEAAGARIDAAFKKLSKTNSTSGYKESLEAAKKMVKEIRKVFSEEIDLSNPSKELQKFDEQVIKMCGNLDNYFESLKAKLQDLLSVMGSGRNMTNNIPRNENNITQIEEIKRQNDELEAQIRKQTEEIARQQEKWKQLADAVRTNNVAAVEKLTQETDEATKRLKLDSVKGSLKMLAGEMDDFAEKMMEAEGDVEILKVRLDSLREQGAGNEQIEQAEIMYGKALEKLEGMKTEYNMMSEQQKEYINELQEANGHHVRMRTQIMNAREEMMQMIKSGQMGTPMFQKLAKEAGEMRKEMALANAYMQYYGTPNSHLAALKEGLQGVAGAAGLVIGVMGIFNEKSEKMAEIQTKIQAILGVIIGLETTYSAVKKTSNLMIAVSELQTWALVKAKQAEASATALATVRQAAYNLVAKANPYILLASVIGMLVVGIYKLITANKKAADSEKAHQKEIENTRKAEENRLKTLGKHTGDLLAKYHALQRQWAALRTEAEKQEFLDSNISKFQELSKGVKSVTDAEKFLVELAPQVIAALRSVAEAEAYEEMYKKAITEKVTNWEMRKKSRKTGDYYETEKGDKWHNTTNGIPDEWKKAGLTTKDYVSRMTSMVSSEAKLTKEGVDKINAYREQQAKKVNEELQKRYDENVEAFGQMYDKALEKSFEANKKLGELEIGGGKNKGTNSTGTTTDKRNSYLSIIDEQRIKQERAVKDMELSTAQAEIDAMKEGSEKTVRQIHLDYEKKYEEIDREYEDLRRKKIEEARKLWEANPANKGKDFNPLSVDTSYTKEENDNYIKRLEANEAAYKESLHKFQVEDTKYQIEYLKNYGSFQEQKMAIAAEYDAKIAQESNDWAKKSLEEQKKKALDEIELTRIKFDIDWGSVFGNLANRSIRELREIKKELEALSDSGEIQDITQIEELQNAISALYEELASKRGGFVALRESFDDLRESTKNLTIAETNLEQARAEGNAEAIRSAEKELQLARQRKKTSEREVEEAKKASAKILETIADFDFTSFSGVFNGLKDLSPTLDSVFKTNFSGIFESLGDELMSAIGSLGDSLISLTSGLISSLFSSYDDHVERQLAVYDSLKESIDNLADKINSGSLKEALESYEKQLEILDLQISSSSKALVDAMQDEKHTACHYTTNFDSVNDYLKDEYLTKDQMDDLATFLKKQYGLDFTDISQLWTLTPEQLKETFSTFPLVRAAITNAINKVKYESSNEHGDEMLQALENYLDLAGKFEELELQMNIRLIGLSPDEIMDDFRSMLDDMENDVDDFSDDITKKIANAFVNAKLSEKIFDVGGVMKSINDELEDWYGELTKLMAARTNGEVDEEGFNTWLGYLKSQYADITKRAMELRDMAYEAAGYDGSEAYKQEAKTKGFQAMSQDTGDELNGRFTAIQVGVYDIRDITLQTRDILMRMELGQGGISTTIGAMQDAVATANSHLSAISKNTKKLTEFGEILEDIRDNTKNM